MTAKKVPPKKADPKEPVKSVKCKCGKECGDLNYQSSRRVFCPDCARERLYFDAITGRVRHRYRADKSPNGLLKPKEQKWATPLEVPMMLDRNGTPTPCEDPVRELLEKSKGKLGIHCARVKGVTRVEFAPAAIAIRKYKAALNLIRRLQTVDLEKPSNIPLATNTLFSLFGGGSAVDIESYTGSLSAYANAALNAALSDQEVQRAEGPGGMVGFVPMLLIDKEAVVTICIHSLSDGVKKKQVLRNKISHSVCFMTKRPLPKKHDRIMSDRGQIHSVCWGWLHPRVVSGEYIQNRGGVYEKVVETPPELAKLLTDKTEGMSLPDRIRNEGFTNDYDGVRALEGIGRTMSVEVECNPTLLSMVNLYFWGKHGQHLVSRHRDGSLRGDNAAEYVSPILQESNYQRWVEDLCERLDAVVYRRCGLHIWIGTHDYTCTNLSALAQWCQVNQGRFADMVTPDRTHNWGEYNVRGGPMRLPDTFARPVKGRKAFIKYYYGKEVLGSSLRGIKRMGDQNDRRFPDAKLHRYQWLNIHGHFRQDAIEIRLHQGTTDCALILNWMRMWHEIVEFFSNRRPLETKDLAKLPPIEKVVSAECLSFYDGIQGLLSEPAPESPPEIDKHGFKETKLILPSYNY